MIQEPLYGVSESNSLWLNVALLLFAVVILVVLIFLAGRTLTQSTGLKQFVWFTAIRLLEKKRIALFSLAAVTLCTAMILIVMSVMGGFVEQIREKSHGLMGDIILEGDPTLGFPYYDGFVKKLLEPPYDKIVLAATPIINTPGLFRMPKPRNTQEFWTNPVLIQGIELQGKIAVSKFGQSLNLHKKNSSEIELSKPIKADDASTGLIAGLDVYGLAYRDSDGVYHRIIRDPVWPCTVSVIPLTVKGKVIDASAPSITKSFYLVDDSRTGVFDIDKQYVYVGFNILQNMLYMNEQKDPNGVSIPARTHQLHVKLRPGVPLNFRIVSEIEDAWVEYSEKFEDPLLSEVRVNRWEDYNATYIAAVENERRLMILLFGIISIVAVFLILAIFYMIVVEKTRDIGILKSIGASANQIAAIFLAYAGFIGLVGSIIGTILGYKFVKHINDIQNWLIHVFGWRIWNREVYAFDDIPSLVKTEDMIVVVVAAIISSVIGAIIPAIRAAKMNPVETLRYE
jgi:lipoprotein-releasing system permease protein